MSFVQLRCIVLEGSRVSYSRNEFSAFEVCSHCHPSFACLEKIFDVGNL